MTTGGRLMVATIGLHEHSRIEFAIARRPASSIVMIHSSHEKSRNAAKRIEEKYGSTMVKCIERDPWDYEGLLITAMTVPESYPELIPEYHIGLGTRVMTMALALAAMFTGSEMYIVIEDEEKTMRELKEIPLLPFRMMQIQKRIYLDVLAEAENKGKGNEGFESKVL
ncbi:MAG: hypothetical protein EAX95_16435, partial [Candidatus Thorarchaeota archaeon]|nr:hypothetical protein [Candidatus Thorarchaeota archaeon]